MPQIVCNNSLFTLYYLDIYPRLIAKVTPTYIYYDITTPISRIPNTKSTTLGLVASLQEVI
ncbi:hypothetical protein TMEN_2770 [Trichophyton mentagrophytes]|nr:hypothetical protein TMEN_2770 [Trichophyton mentagrophytes]